MAQMIGAPFAFPSPKLGKPQKESSASSEKEGRPVGHVTVPKLRGEKKENTSHVGPSLDTGVQQGKEETTGHFAPDAPHFA